MNSRRAWRPAKDQQELPFRIQIIRLLLNRLDLTTHEKHLLRVFLSAIGDQPDRRVYMSLETLAEAMSTSPRTVQRASRGLRIKDLVSRIGRPRRGRSCDTWLVRIANIWERGGLVFGNESTRQVGVSTHESTRQVGVSDSPIRNEQERKEEELPPPTSPIGDDWQPVEASLFKFGIDAAPLAVQAARDNGCSPAEIRSLLEYARRDASRWNSPAGALYRRIMAQTPGRPVDEGWPRGTAAAEICSSSRVRETGRTFNQEPSETIE